MKKILGYTEFRGAGHPGRYFPSMDFSTPETAEFALQTRTLWYTKAKEILDAASVEDPLSDPMGLITGETSTQAPQSFAKRLAHDMMSYSFRTYAQKYFSDVTEEDYVIETMVRSYLGKVHWDEYARYIIDAIEQG